MEGIWDDFDTRFGVEGHTTPPRPTAPAVGRYTAPPTAYRKPLTRRSRARGFLVSKAGDGLLSHPLSGAVPSALRGLTAVFGMGTGVALSR